MTTGIYCIENLVNGKKYIGKASDIKKRFSGHLNSLEKNTHPNIHLQGSWKIHGKNSFVFYEIEICKKEELSEKEIYYISLFDTYNKGYNMTRGGDGSFGLYPTKEAREKMSKAGRGRRKSEETKTKMSLSAFGKHPSLETLLKISKIKKETTQGEDNPNVKLTDNDIYAILDMYYNKRKRPIEIYKHFNISKNHFQRIRDGKNRKEVYTKFMKERRMLNDK